MARDAIPTRSQRMTCRTCWTLFFQTLPTPMSSRLRSRHSYNASLAASLRCLTRHTFPFTTTPCKRWSTSGGPSDKKCPWPTCFPSWISTRCSQAIMCIRIHWLAGYRAGMVHPHPGHHHHNQPGDVHADPWRRHLEILRHGPGPGDELVTAQLRRQAAGPAERRDWAVATGGVHHCQYGRMHPATHHNLFPRLVCRAGRRNLQPISISALAVDGAVVWLNGQEAFRTNMPTGPIT